MLRTTLHYFPDASRDEHVEYGALLLYFKPQGKRFGFFSPSTGAMVSAQSATNDPHMRHVVIKFQEFINHIVEHVGPCSDESDFAAHVLASLPLNFRYGPVQPFPPDEVAPLIAELMGNAVYGNEAGNLETAGI